MQQSSQQHCAATNIYQDNLLAQSAKLWLDGRVHYSCSKVLKMNKHRLKSSIEASMQHVALTLSRFTAVTYGEQANGAPQLLCCMHIRHLSPVQQPILAFPYMPRASSESWQPSRAYAIAHQTSCSPLSCRIPQSR